MNSALLPSVLLMVASSLVGSFGAVFLKMGSARVSRNPLSFANPRLVLGVALYLLSSVFYVLGIRGGELTILYPIVSLSYIWTAIWARFFFREAITGRKVVALGLILNGVILVGAGAH
jgi:drug/metabolite transporter (DMT)-like permease